MVLEGLARHRHRFEFGQTGMHVLPEGFAAQR